MNKISTLIIIFFAAFLPHAHAQTVAAESSLSNPSTSTSAYGERIFYYRPPVSTVQDFIAHAQDIDIIAPQTFEITPALTASGSVPTDLASAAQTYHVKMMPLIANSNFSQALIHAFLASTTAQDAVISYLITTAKSQNFIGWQFDLENISVNDRDVLSAFVQKAATALHANGLILSIAAVARTTDTPPLNTATTSADYDFYENWSGAYDYTALGKSVDFVSIMTYDDPDSTGPSTPISFVTGTLANLAGKIPPNKISLGIPLFYWGWSVNPAKRKTSGGTYDMLGSRIATYPHISGWNADYGVPWLMYWIGKTAYIIWYENTQSIAEKAAFIPALHLRGFSAWVLGNEDPKIWNTL